MLTVKRHGNACHEIRLIPHTLPIHERSKTVTNIDLPSVLHNTRTTADIAAHKPHKKKDRTRKFGLSGIAAILLCMVVMFGKQSVT